VIDAKVGTVPAGEATGNWAARHRAPIQAAIRIVLGMIWLVDGALKFTSGFVSSFSAAVQTASSNAPGWLSGWYSFWQAQANASPTTIVYTVGVLEIALGVALVFGLLRKVAYLGGIALSLLIWAVPEGFGGPYAPGAGGTDVGAGIIYALVFLALIVFNSVNGPSRLSLDYYIERRVPLWSRLAEFSHGSSPSARTPPTLDR
jgi:uncharacterized membrane protein YphA (DoxX/SURF4 family)